MHQQVSLRNGAVQVVDRGGERRTNHVVFIHPPHIVDCLLRRGQIGELLHVGLCFHRKLCAGLHRPLVVAAAFFGGNDNYAIGTARSPNTGCCCIFQQGNALYVFGVETLKCIEVGIAVSSATRIVGNRESVDHDERSNVGKQCACAANGKAFATSTVVVSLHTSHQSVESLREIGGMSFFKILAVHYAVGTRGSLFRDGLITCHHHFVESVVRVHAHIALQGVGAFGQGKRLSVHTQIGYLQLAIASRYFQLIVSIGIGIGL